VLETDLFRAWRRSPLAENRQIVLARGLTVVLGVIATGVAFVMADIGNILDGLSGVISLFNAPVLALFLLGMLWRRTSFVAWLAALAVALPATSFVNSCTQVDWSWRFPFSFALAAAITVCLSLVLPREARS